MQQNHDQASFELKQEEPLLKRLYVDNVRCLSNFELTPAQVSVLVGANGVGKSTVLEVLRALFVLLNADAPSIQTLFGPGSCTRWDSRKLQKVELDVSEPGGQDFSYSLEIEHDPDKRATVIRQERLIGNGQLLYSSSNGEVQLFGDDASANPRTRFPVDPRRSFLPVLEPRGDNKGITAFKNWLTRCWLFKLRPEQLDPFSESEARAIATDGRNFVSWYRTLQQEAPEVTQKVRKDLAPIIPGLHSIKLSPAGSSKLLTFDCSLGGNSFSLTLAELSDGQRALLILYTILHAVADRASLLLIDEPDNFVADPEIQPWLAALRQRVVDTGTGTLLILSHHPAVIDYIAADQVLRLSRDNGPTRVATVDVDRTKGLAASEWLRLEGTNA